MVDALIRATHDGRSQDVTRAPLSLLSSASVCCLPSAVPALRARPSPEGFPAHLPICPSAHIATPSRCRRPPLRPREGARSSPARAPREPHPRQRAHSSPPSPPSPAASTHPAAVPARRQTTSCCRHVRGHGGLYTSARRRQSRRRRSGRASAASCEARERDGPRRRRGGTGRNGWRGVGGEAGDAGSGRVGPLSPPQPDAAARSLRDSAPAPHSSGCVAGASAPAPHSSGCVAGAESAGRRAAACTLGASEVEAAASPLGASCLKDASRSPPESDHAAEPPGCPRVSFKWEAPARADAGSGTSPCNGIPSSPPSARDGAGSASRSLLVSGRGSFAPAGLRAERDRSTLAELPDSACKGRDGGVQLEW